MFHLLLLGEKDGRVKKEKGIVCPAVQLNPGNDIVAIVFEIKKTNDTYDSWGIVALWPREM